MNMNLKTVVMDLSVKEKNDLTQETKFYCPTEGCVFSKGMGKSFKRKMLVDQHYLNCHSERKFKCTNCGKAYAIEWQLRYHSKTCGMDWVCLSCNKCYKERLSLITHCKRHKHILPDNAILKKKSKNDNDNNNSSNQPHLHHTLRNEVHSEHNAESYLNNNFLLGLSNRSLLNLNAATNNFNYTG